MYKIFKYPCGWDGNRQKWWAMMPRGEVIRTDYVENNDYKGWWVWAIVKPADIAQKIEFNWIKRIDIKPNHSVQLGLLEEQSVTLNDVPFEYRIDFRDGKIFLDVENLLIIPKKEYNYHVLGFKTGQEMPSDIHDYEYAGFAPLKIKNEIAVYFFLKKV